MMRNRISVTIFTTIVTLTVLLCRVPGSAYASCQPIFGGGTTCADSSGIGVDKLIQNPETKELVDSLDPDNPFVPNQQIVFKITVANSGKTKLSHISVKDTLPAVIAYVSGGTHDPKDNSVSYTIDSLDAGRTTVTTITGKILAGTLLKTCYANQVTVLVSGKQAADNASFCVAGKNEPVMNQTQGQNPTPVSGQDQTQNTMQGVPQAGNRVYPQPQSKKTPATGPEMFSLLALVPTALSGLYIAKKARKV